MAVLYGNIIIYFGGVGEEFFNDLFFFYIESGLFKKMNYNGIKMPKMANMQAVLTQNSQIYIFGGYDSTGLRNTLYIYDIKKNTFS